VKKYAFLFIDADGTILDFKKAERHALERTFLEIRGAGPEEAYYEAFSRINESLWRDLENSRIDVPGLKYMRAALFLRETGLDGDPARWASVYVRFLSGGSFALPGARQALAFCSGRYRTAVITNGISEVQRPRIRGSFIPEYVGDVFISEDVGYTKPQIQFFEYVMNAMGVSSPDEVLIIGDGLTSDILGGNRSGIDTLWIDASGSGPGTAARPDHVAGSLYEAAVMLGMKDDKGGAV